MSESTEHPFVSVPNVPVPPAPPADAPPVHHANWLHSVLMALEGAAAIVRSPAVVALLPAKYQGYAAAVSAIATVAEDASASPASLGLS